MLKIFQKSNQDIYIYFFTSATTRTADVNQIVSPKINEHTKQLFSKHWWGQEAGPLCLKSYLNIEGISMFLN